MELWKIVLIGVSLAIDSFLVSISIGCAQQRFYLKNGFTSGGVFGFFQVTLFLIGYILSFYVESYIHGFEDWVAFFILVIIGIKMIMDGIKHHKEGNRNCIVISFQTYVLLGIATSIDAFGVGFTMRLLDISIVSSSISVFFFSFVLGFAGVFLGTCFGRIKENYLHVGAGVLLCLMGVSAFFL